MIDLHTHTYFSDGVLGPFELVYRAKLAGYTAIGLTDHGDDSNIDIIIPRMVRAGKVLEKEYGITVLPGIELTYIPPRMIPSGILRARRLGARLVVVHGETPNERVPAGTNRAGIEGGADIIAHPGFISVKEAVLAQKKDVCLEITTRKGHSKGNPHVAKVSRKTGARLVLNTDTHCPEDLLSARLIHATLRAAQLSRRDFDTLQENAGQIIKRRRR